MKTLTLPTEEIRTADLNFQIQSSIEEIEIETENFYYQILIEVDTIYEKGDADVGYPGGYIAEEIYSTVQAVFDSEGDEITLSDDEKKEIETYIDKNANIDCYGNNF